MSLMDNILSFNVRGLNSSLKQKGVSKVLVDNKIGLACLIETKIKKNAATPGSISLLQNWAFIFNLQAYDNGRLLVIWKPDLYCITPLFISPQLIHMSVDHIASGKTFQTSFIYGFNDRKDRLQLWDQLKQIKSSIHGAWLVAGDFNCPLSKEDRLGSPVSDIETKDFRECIDVCELEDLAFGGCFFTWNNKQQGSNRVFSKIDRILCNEEWSSLWPNSVAKFHLPGSFDHSPGVIMLDQSFQFGRKAFKFFNMWTLHPSFKNMVDSIWSSQMDGTRMFQIVQKLKKLKYALRNLNKTAYCELGAKWQHLQEKLLQIQRMLHVSPDDHSIRNQEKEALIQFDFVDKAYHSFLRQKTKLTWMKEGDLNTAVFHKSLKMQQSRNRINWILKDGATLHDPDQISEAFVDYYKELLGPSPKLQKIQWNIIRQGKILSSEQRDFLIADFSENDVKDAMFSIPPDKAPGPDGFGSCFYQSCWDIVGKDISKAILDFFKTGKLLKQINSTAITLIPKGQNPIHVHDFRPNHVAM